MTRPAPTPAGIRSPGARSSCTWFLVGDWLGRGGLDWRSTIIADSWLLHWDKSAVVDFWRFQKEALRLTFYVLRDEFSLMQVLNLASNLTLNYHCAFEMSIKPLNKLLDGGPNCKVACVAAAMVCSSAEVCPTISEESAKRVFLRLSKCYGQYRMQKEWKKYFLYVLKCLPSRTV